MSYIVTEKGTVTIPSAIRKKHNLKKGSKVKFIDTERGTKVKFIDTERGTLIVPVLSLARSSRC